MRSRFQRICARLAETNNIKLQRCFWAFFGSAEGADIALLCVGHCWLTVTSLTAPRLQVRLPCFTRPALHAALIFVGCIACIAKFMEHVILSVFLFCFVIVILAVSFFSETMPPRIACEARVVRAGALRARPRALRALRTQCAEAWVPEVGK